MIVWLLAKRQRKYLYLAFAIIIIDMIIGPLLIAWEIELLRNLT